MIRIAFRFLSAEVRGLHAAVFVLAFSALLSSLLALARDRLLAHTFGAGATLDLYYAAFRIPDLIFVATGALVSVYILIPELARRSQREQHEYIDTIIVGFSLFACAVAAIAAVCAPYLLAFLFPQVVASGEIDTLTILTRIMLMQPILLGLSNIFAAITQSKNRYTLYSVSPLVYNVGIIVGVAGLYPLWGITGLAWGVVLGALLHAFVQLPAILRDGFFAKVPQWPDMSVLLSTMAISLPRALSLSMSQISFLALISLAGLLASGSIAIFVFAFNLQAVPLAIIGASYSVAAFPTLAAALSKGEIESFLEHVAIAMRYVFFWSLPTIALVIVLRAHMVRAVLGSGEFDWTDTRLTAAVFALLATSLAAQGVTLLLMRAYYASGRTLVPFVVSSMTAILTIALGLGLLLAFKDQSTLHALENVMRLSDVPGTDVLALAIAYAAASIVGAITLIVHFQYRFGDFLSRISKTWWESVIAACAAMIAAYIVLYFMGPLDVGSTTVSVFLKGFAGGSTGLIVAGIVYWTLGSVELSETLLSAYGRIKRTIEPAVGAAVATSAEEQPGQS